MPPDLATYHSLARTTPVNLENLISQKLSVLQYTWPNDFVAENVLVTYSYICFKFGFWNFSVCFKLTEKCSFLYLHHLQCHNCGNNKMFNYQYIDTARVSG